MDGRISMTAYRTHLHKQGHGVCRPYLLNAFPPATLLPGSGWQRAVRLCLGGKREGVKLLEQTNEEIRRFVPRVVLSEALQYGGLTAWHKWGGGYTYDSRAAAEGGVHHRILCESRESFVEPSIGVEHIRVGAP